MHLLDQVIFDVVREEQEKVEIVRHHYRLVYAIVPRTAMLAGTILLKSHNF
jgi:hypothetical protein